MSQKTKKQWKEPQGKHSGHEGDISEDDIHTDQAGIVGTPISKSQDSSVQTLQVTVMELLGDQRFLILLAILGLLQALIGGVVYILLQQSITGLKSCSRGSQNVDSSLPCSDCMCVATDGFSSVEFKNILTKLDTLSRDSEQRNSDQKVMEANINDVKKKVDSSESEVADAKERVNYFKVIVASLQNDMQDTLKKDKVDTWKEEMLDTLNKSLDDRVKSVENGIQDKVKETSTTLEQILNEKIQEGVKASGEKINALEGRLEKEKTQRENDVKEVSDNVKKIKTSAEQNIKDVNEKVVGMTGQMDYFYSELKGINIYIVVFLLMAVLGIIYGAYKVLLSRQAFPGGTDLPVTRTYDDFAAARNYDPPMTKLGSQSRMGGQSSLSVIERITRRHLRPGLSIVSFNASSQQFHKDLIAGILASSSVNVRAHLVQKPVEISQINPYRLVFIFVDFNERNIILENPETEIGDLRRLTTVGFQKMGCDVFVVYVRHRDSQALEQGQMYSPRLYSVDKHQVLSQLKERNRVLSVYNNFLPHQVEFLEDCFKWL